MNDSTNPYEPPSHRKSSHEDEALQGGSSSDSPAVPAHPLTNPSFVGFIATQFLGAFNDNLFKQLLLLLAIPKLAEGVAAEGPDLQGVATIVFGIPFVIFGGIAGYLADRYSKRRVIVLSKVAEIVVMALGLAAFLAAPWVGFYGLWVVLFLMGLQSTFFGPGKYGILPEMMQPNQLARANGIVLMTTFIAIIFGTSLAGWLKDSVVSPDLPRIDAAQKLWVGSIFCILVAVLGTAASLLVRPVKAAAPGLPFRLEYLGIPGSILTLLRRDRSLLLALGASCVFWLIAGLTIQAVNSLCKIQLGLSDTLTSVMVALISIGIAAGGALAGWLSRGGSGQKVLVMGMWGVVVWSGLLAITIPGQGHLLGLTGSAIVLVLLGAAAAFFAIPIQVFLQARPPDDLKGRMIAVMNQANFLAIVVSGALYMLIDGLITTMGWPRSALFAAMALLFLPVAFLYRMEPDESNPSRRDDRPVAS